GSGLVLTAIFSLVLILSVSSFLLFVSNQLNISKKAINTIKAFNLADGGIQYAEYYVSSHANPADLTDHAFTTDKGTAIITITRRTGTPLFDVTSYATVNGDSKGIEALIEKNPPSKVFDYVYFLNNWGYMWGSSISVYGDMRSNGHFGIKSNPNLNGDLLAAGNIHEGANYNDTLEPSDVNGFASDPEYWHPQSKKLPMPNLYQLQFYRDLATEKQGKIWVGRAEDGPTAENTIVNGIYGDEEGEGKHLILASQGVNEIIHIDGPVVIEGNVIIRGKITGKGCIYSGKNIYLAGDVEYNNPADYDGRPWNKTNASYESEIRQWVEDNRDADLVGFAAQENIVAGNWTKTTWHPMQYQSMWENWGAEDAGHDGIPHTNDTGEGDGSWEQSYEDIDEDGVYDDNYSYNVDIVPSDESGTPLEYEDFDNRPNWANNFNAVHQHINIKSLDGIYYTNHIMAAGTQQFQFHGALVSRDEAIVYSSYLNFHYDDRIHSRFRDYDNYDIIIDIPRDLTARVVFWREL
ncbi:MAG: hypothetical protein JW928_06485, partial [Candidatus Aureabacteria bacterium]|nr:hypothetical protein [Candidatus Auribacterota bacterium]